MEAIEKSNEQEVIAKLNERLGQLKAASEIAVTDQPTFIQSAQVKLDLESYIRAVESHYEPDLGPAEETVRRIKLAMGQFLIPAKQWLMGLNNRRKEWATQEKMAAQREQDKINEANRRAAAKAHVKAPPPVEVKPNIPAVPGTRNVTVWRYRILDAKLIPEQYWTLNEKKLAEDVRASKSETNIPGVEVYFE